MRRLVRVILKYRYARRRLSAVREVWLTATPIL